MRIKSAVIRAEFLGNGLLFLMNKPVIIIRCGKKQMVEGKASVNGYASFTNTNTESVDATDGPCLSIRIWSVMHPHSPVLFVSYRQGPKDSRPNFEN